MIEILPPIYTKELFYSLISRYQTFSAVSNRQVTMTLFNKENKVRPNILYPINLNYFCSILPNGLNLTSDYIIENHTILPLYKPFLTEGDCSEIVKTMKYSNDTNKDNVTKRKLRFNVEYGKREFNYCPLCIREGVDKIGEYFLNLEHQVPGNKVCHKHLVSLNTLKVPDNISSYEYIDINKLNLDCEINDKTEIEEFINLSFDINSLFNSNLDACNLALTNKNYDIILQKRGYKFKHGSINKKKLMKDFLEYYSEEFLNYVNTSLNEKGSISWLYYLGMESYKYLHPIKHLLFIRFMFGSFNNFINFNYEEEQLKLEWMIEQLKNINIKINRSKNTNMQILLKTAYQAGLLNNFIYYFKQENINNDTIDNYKNIIKNFIEKNHNIRRSELKNILDIEYIIIEIFDKKWIDGLIFSQGNKKVENKAIKFNWNNKDVELRQAVIKVINDIRNEVPLRRITHSYVAKKVGYRGIVKSEILCLLPKTKEVLDENIEDVETFKKRKIIHVIKELRDTGGNVVISKLCDIINISKDYQQLRPFILDAIENIENL